MRRLGAPVAAVMVGMALAGPVAAEDPHFPEAPDPAGCTVEPIPLEELNSSIATPIPATPAPGRGAVVPAGTPATADEAQVILETVRTLVACYNAGELLRSYALYTPEYLHHLFARQGPYAEVSYLSLATPMPAEADERVQILDIADQRRLPDGRLAANVVLRYQVIPMPKRFLMTFVETPEGWRIDDILGEISFSVP